MIEREQLEKKLKQAEKETKQAWDDYELEDEREWSAAEELYKADERHSVACDKEKDIRRQLKELESRPKEQSK